VQADTKLLLVGCGKMGGALLQRVADKVSACVVEPSGIPAGLQSIRNVAWVDAVDKVDLAFIPDIVIFAIKPQQMASALPAYTKYKNTVFLSIAAGFSIASIETALGGGHAIVRSMPNLPASIGQGMSVAVANQAVTPAQRTLCDQLLHAVGETAWVEKEELIDAVTAVSGSGPAYIFALCEVMAKVGEGLGLSPSLSAKLARQTVIGSGNLLAQSLESAEALRKAVTSPGGTTEAALKELLGQGGLPDIMVKTMTAALQRAQQLARLA
jgi:pyrroline-5-carboxylate reductase